MELIHLHTFVTVAEEKGITRAAKRLFTTPSTVSMHIKALEDELNIQLFVRTARGVELTEKGEQLRAKAEHAVVAARDFLNAAREIEERLIGRASVGLNAAPGFLRVPALIAAMRAQHPDVELHFVPSASGAVLADLRAGRLDVGYVFGEVTDPLLKSVLLHEAELVVAAPRAWEQRIAGADWAQLARLPWIDVGVGCPFQKLIDELFAARGLQYRRAAQSGDEMTRAQLVAAGVGLSLLEKSEALHAHDRVLIYDTAPLPCALSLVYLHHRQHEPLIKALAGHIAAVWKR
ncbi:MAG: LysR family transcriptional regulator [Anaerolineae bacterium]|nr:LysR family transcriptional regulator [Anaerolineae bacterium]